MLRYRYKAALELLKIYGLAVYYTLVVHKLLLNLVLVVLVLVVFQLVRIPQLLLQLVLLLYTAQQHYNHLLIADQPLLMPLALLIILQQLQLQLVH